MYHYVYYSYEEWGRGYIGVRSCKCLPEEDTKYFGSFYDKTFKPTSKIILAEFPDRESALAAEVELHAFYQVHKNPHFANKARQTSLGYANDGTSLLRYREDKPDFQSRVGKLGAKKRHEMYPLLSSETLKRTHQRYPELSERAAENLKKWAADNPKEAHEIRSRAAQTLNEFYRNNYEAALERGQNGLKKMNEYWETRERSVCLRLPVQVTLPDGERLSFRSKTEAFKALNIPKSAFYFIEKGNLPEDSKWFGYSVTRIDTDESQS